VKQDVYNMARYPPVEEVPAVHNRDNTDTWLHVHSSVGLPLHIGYLYPEGFVYGHNMYGTKLCPEKGTRLC
jgi:hypothetical protein